MTDMVRTQYRKTSSYTPTFMFVTAGKVLVIPQEPNWKEAFLIFDLVAFLLRGPLSGD